MLAKRRVITNIRAVMVAAIALAVLISTQSFAQANTSTNVLKISPVRSDVEIKPGESKEVQATVTNLTKQPITVRPIQNDFVSGDERGTPALILDSSKFAPTHSLKRFMKPLSDITIPASQSKTVKVTIAVPKDAQAGGYFGAIRFAPTSPESGGQVNLSASVASLILLTVPGNIVEKLNLTSFEIQQGGTTATYFQSSNDLHTSFRFENKGNVQVGPIGKISVKEGNNVIYETDFNNKSPRDVILPDGARRWDVPLKQIGSFGNYTVSATFTYGKKNQTIEVSRSFWVVPQGIIIAAVAGTLALVGLIVGIWLFLRSYKRRILRSHGRGRRY